MSARDFSLDLALEEGGDATHLDVLPDDTGPSTESVVAQREMDEGITGDLAEAIKTLSPREREVIELRYLTEDPPTLREVGARWGVSRERARQIEAVARDKLKKHLVQKSDVLREMLPEALEDMPVEARA